MTTTGQNPDQDMDRFWDDAQWMWAEMHQARMRRMAAETRLAQQLRPARARLLATHVVLIPAAVRGWLAAIGRHARAAHDTSRGAEAR